jgi:two-component system, sensor histidine kinase PdtaS
VPLSLFLTEALTNAMKYASPAEGQDMPHLSVSLTRQDEDRAILRIANSIGGKRDATEALPGGLEASTGLGAQLLEAFAQQIGGVLEHEETEDSFALTLRFDVLALRMAEARHAPTDPDAQDDDAAPGDTGEVTEPDTEDGQGKGGKTG